MLSEVNDADYAAIFYVGGHGPCFVSAIWSGGEGATADALDRRTLLSTPSALRSLRR